MIGITSEQSARVESILNGIQGGPEKAFFSVINRALDTVRTTTGRQIREVYAISQKDLRAKSNVRMKKAGANDLVGEIAFSSGTIPLYRFNVTPKQPTPKQRLKVKAAVLKSSSQTEFEHAFIMRLKNGHVGMFERETRQRKPIKEFQSPSIKAMVENSAVIEEVEKAANETIEKRIPQEINRILAGYGGRS